MGHGQALIAHHHQGACHRQIAHQGGQPGRQPQQGTQAHQGINHMEAPKADQGHHGEGTATDPGTIRTQDGPPGFARHAHVGEMEIRLEGSGDQQTEDHAGHVVAIERHQEQAGADFRGEEGNGHGGVPVALEAVTQFEGVADHAVICACH
ncbi:hypothetical protein CBW56_14530 [Denitratisoma oestradiolicum]|nr:hypothetical protein CBW56_14530 [Denitratisoma oestradiolicum]